MRARLSLLLASGVLAGCSVTSGLVQPGQVAAVAAALTSFDSCDDVLEHVKKEALRHPDAWGGGVIPLLEGDMGTDQFLADERTGPVIPTAGDVDHSTTNLQEVGVDEPDIVKTDGRLVVTVTGSRLRVVDVDDGTPEDVGSVALTGVDEYADASLLLDGDRAMVFVRRTSMIAYDSDRPSFAPDQSVPATTTVLSVDLSDPADPVIDSSLDVDARYLDARVVDGTVRLVLGSSPSLPFPTTSPREEFSPEDHESQRRAAIAASDINDWLPGYRLRSGADESSGQLVACDQLRYPKTFAGVSTISVLTLGFEPGLNDGSAIGVLTDGDTVYSSADRLYVTTTTWPSVIADGPIDLGPEPAIGFVEPVTTAIHAFDISGDDPARYVASGSVDGTTIGRYAMSEYDGVLRVATTTTPATGEAALSESQVSTLAERDGELVELGSVGGLGVDEQIYAVRYFGPTAYVVTFRQTDPLYRLDLSDPTAPQVTGELKITGYSSYLHEVGEGRLVGVGQEATEDGRAVGAQISLFDVSGTGSPAKLDGYVVPGGWSDAESDPHAFLYWPDTSQLVIPMYAEDEAGALVLSVGGDSLTEQGTVTHAGLTASENPAEIPAEKMYNSTVRRSLVIDDALYTLWDDGLQVNELDGLELRDWLPLA